MNTRRLLLLIVLILLAASNIKAQQISKEELIFLTPEWKGERFADGRPKVPDDILKLFNAVLEQRRFYPHCERLPEMPSLLPRFRGQVSSVGCKV